MSAVIGTTGTAFLLDLDAYHEVVRAVMGASLLAEAYLETRDPAVLTTMPTATDGAPRAVVRPLTDLFTGEGNAQNYLHGMTALLALLEDAPRLGRTW